MCSVHTLSDKEREDEDMGTLNPIEVTAVERIYDTYDCPKDMSYISCFYTWFEKKIGADEWFIMSRSGNKHLLLRFPARIVRGCRYSKLSSYGNKDRDMSKIKMVWALNLKLEGPVHLERRGTYIENVLHLIQQERDDVLNAGLSYEQEPRVHAFTRRQENGSYLVLVNSDNLFDNVPFSSAGSPVKITRSILETSATNPHAVNTGESSTARDIGSTGQPATPKKKGLTLADLPYPQGRFTTVKNVAGSVPVIIPPVRDRHGVPVTPVQYNSLLTDGTLVDVLTTLRMWQIKPDYKNPNGSHAYQLILKRMQILPTVQDGLKAMTTVPSSPATPSPATLSNSTSRGEPHESPPSSESLHMPLTPTPAHRGGKATGKQKRALPDSSDKAAPPQKRTLRATESTERASSSN
ncbi:hypothetical protein JB92DRAFT_3020131 [Gautieria morchelliformis]|nr:hypothetical protein JB92DRAFT_3020131 [Gautieria morchelliformis]